MPDIDMEPQTKMDHPSTKDTIRLDDSQDTIRLENHSDSSDVPATPPSPPNSSDFGRLVPVNDPAKIAFDRVVTVLKADGSWNPHCQKFIHVSNTKSQLISGRAIPSDTSECDTEIEEVYTGYFRLNLAILPDNFPRGWLMGAGRPGLDHLGVDFLLTISGKKDGVRGRHAHIRYHNVSRQLMIVPAPGKRVVLNGEEVPREGRVLEMRMGLTIGNLAFRIEFLFNNNTAYNEQLNKIVQQSGTWFSERVESIDVTPSENHLKLQSYLVQAPQAIGAFGVVSPCIDPVGNIYAVKRVQRTRPLFKQVRDEVAILKQFEKHPQICTLVEVIYSDGDDSSMGNRKVNDVYMIIDPWAPKTLHSLMAPEVSSFVRHRAFHQSGQGLRYIHSLGVIHRDLKLDNILVVQRDPIRVVIGDFGHATTATNCQDHEKGTIRFLAPEIIELKEKSEESKTSSSTSSSYWSCKSDVFSWGMVGWALLHGYFKCSKNGINRTLHAELLQTLQTSRTALDEIVGETLAWDTGLRPEMHDVLLRPCWSEPETPFSARKRALSGL